MKKHTPKYFGFSPVVRRLRKNGPNRLSHFLVTALFVLAAIRCGDISAGTRRNITFNRFSIENGLSHNTVTSIIQDRTGFLWIGTQDGLNVYDGYGFKVFRHDPDDPSSLAGNFILSLHEDREGRIWIGTYKSGLNMFDPATGRFTRYIHDPEDTTSIAVNDVGPIYEDEDGHLWIALREGLDLFDPETGRFSHYSHDPDNDASLGNNTVYCTYRDSFGLFWVGTKNGLNLFERDSGTFTHIHVDPSDATQLSNGAIHCIYEDKRGMLWFGTEGGLNRYDRPAGTFTSYRYDPSDRSSISDDIVLSLCEDETGAFWVGTSNGLDIMDRENGTFEHHRHDPINERSIGSDWVKVILQDRIGIFWIGTSNGVSKYVPGKAIFNHHRHNPLHDDGLNCNHIRAFAEDASGYIWICTDFGGVNRYDPSSDNFDYFRHDPDDPKSLPTEWLETIHIDRKNNVWVGTGEGLCLFDRETKAFHSYRHDPGDPKSLTGNWILDIYEDSRDNLWVCTGSGLNRFDAGEKNFNRYYHDPDDSSTLSNPTVRNVLEDSDGTLWVSTDMGLNRYDTATDSFERIRSKGEHSPDVGDRKINCMHEDSADALWLGTDIGLCRFDRKTHSCELLSMKNGLPNDTVNGILEDDTGRLWVSTNGGIAVLDTVSGLVKVYDSGDGLQSNQFSRGACLKASTGEFYFGGVNGFNRFFPGDIVDNTNVPPVIIESFRILGEEADLHMSFTGTGSIRLNHHENYVTFEYAALDFTSPEKNRYAYILEGLDRQWNEAGTRRYASYSGLPPGNYVFHVKGSNNDGVWNNQGASMAVTVLPPFWGTIWFRIVIVMSVLALAYGVHWLRVRGVKRQKHQLETEVSLRTAELEHRTEELARERRRLFTLLDTLPAFVFLQADDYSIRFANSILTASFKGIHEQPCHRVFHGLSEPCEDCPTLRVIGSNRPESHEWNPINGRSYQMTEYPFHEVDGTPLVLKLALDITDRKQAEIDRLKTEKMQVVLEMAGAASHEFSQPLQVMLGYLDILMQHEVKMDEKTLDRLTRILDQVNRMRGITEKLQKITTYKTKDYFPGKKIIDIDGSSENM